MIKPSSKLLFQQLTKKRRMNDVIIGHEPSGSFLTLEEDGIRIIEYLKTHTIAQTEKKFPKKDIYPFVELLIKKGLVYKIDHRVVAEKAHIADIIQAKPKKLKWAHSPVVQGTILGIIIVGIFLLFGHPELVPKADWFFYTSWFAVLIPTVFILHWVLQFLHELGHYVLMKETGLSTGLSIIHKWHFLLPHANISNARLLPPKQQARVYAGGIIVDLFLLSLGAILVLLDIGVPFWRLVMLLTFIDILFQLVLIHKTDISTIVEQLTGSNNIVESLWKVAMNGCGFCRQKHKISDQEMRAAKEAFPLLILGIIVLVILLFVYLIPIFYNLLSILINTLLLAARSYEVHLLTDSLMALIMLAVFLALYFVSMIREHHWSIRSGFTVTTVFLFLITNYFSVFLLLLAFLFFGSPALIMIAMFFLGLVYGMLFLRMMEHVNLEEAGFARDFFLPVFVAITALLLIVMTHWFSAVTGVPGVQTIHGVAYAAGMIGAMAT